MVVRGGGGLNGAPGSLVSTHDSSGASLGGSASGGDGLCAVGGVPLSDPLSSRVGGSLRDSGTEAAGLGGSNRGSRSFGRGGGLGGSAEDNVSLLVNLWDHSRYGKGGSDCGNISGGGGMELSGSGKSTGHRNGNGGLLPRINAHVRVGIATGKGNQLGILLPGQVGLGIAGLGSSRVSSQCDSSQTKQNSSLHLANVLKGRFALTSRFVVVRPDPSSRKIQLIGGLCDKFIGKS